MNEVEKYTTLWEMGYGNNYESAAGMVLVNLVKDTLNLNGDETILDIGGGGGHLKKHFANYDYTILDLAPNAGADIVADITEWNKPEAFDVGICLDVMEHLPTAFVPDAIYNIARSCDRVIFLISIRPDRFGKKIGEVLHLTVRPSTWWLEQLSPYWKRVTLVKTFPRESFVAICENK